MANRDYTNRKERVKLLIQDNGSLAFILLEKLFNNKLGE